MNFLQRLRFLIFGTPYVVVENKLGECLDVLPVHIIMEVPYMIFRGDRKRLLPEGKSEPQSRWIGQWEPATPNMKLYYTPPNE